MKTSISIVTVIMTSILLMPNVMAANSEVIWTDYKSYRDIKESNEGRKNFREKVFKNFEKHFTQLAARLPENQTLKIEVTDVDLAGDTRVIGIDRLRIVREIDFPRLNFSYQLLDENHKVIKSEDVVLKDMNFMSGSNARYSNDLLAYEKRMLDEWFQDSFSELMIESK